MHSTASVRTPLAALLLVLSLVACGPGHAQGAREQTLALTARVWGLAKYHHPRLVACEVDWDQALLDRLASIQASSGNIGTRSAALSGLLDAAGPTPMLAPNAQTPAWILAAPIDAGLRERLAWLAAQRPVRQCRVAVTPGTGQASFGTDTAHNTPTPLPSQPLRLLAAFRVWSAIEYFFPYKAEIGRDWGDILAEHIGAIADATTPRDYVLALRGLTAATVDSHAYLSPGAAVVPERGPPPFLVRSIEGLFVVTQRRIAASAVGLGDTLIAVDDEALDARMLRLEPWTHGSNQAWRAKRTLELAASGTAANGRYRFRRHDGSEYELSFSRSWDQAFDSALTDQPTWQRRTLDTCTFGLVDMGRLEAADIDTMLQALADTDALVFDLRNYPRGTLWPLADRLFDSRRVVAELSAPALDQPGRFDFAPVSIGGTRPRGYAGRILVLFDERSISQSEYTVMGLQAIGRTITFGSQTAAADGDITYIELPGAVRAYFTGLGVRYPDDRPTQRIGIVPDVHVTPTLAGIAAGRDEVLDAALDCRWRTETPARRSLPGGIYFSPQRSGEGLDIHRDGGANVIAAISYGYDDDGTPTWMLSAGDPAMAGWQSGFTRQHETAATIPQPDYELDPHAGPYAPVCATAEQHALHPRARWRWPAGGIRGDTCALPVLHDGNGGPGGLWIGPQDDLGWGVSLHHADGVAIAVVYAYGNDGEPRWVMGQGAWDGVAPLILPLQRIRGFCRACPPTAIESVPAGQLQFVLSASGDATVSVEAHMDATRVWRRENMPATRLLRASRDAAPH